MHIWLPGYSIQKKYCRLYNMNHRVFHTLALMIIAGILFLPGCATRIPVTTLVPAEVNLQEYRSIDVSEVLPYQFPFGDEPSRTVADFTGDVPVVVYSGLSPFASRNLRSFIFEELTGQLIDTHYFSLDTGSPAATVGMTIIDMDIDEYVYAREEEVSDEDIKVYYLRQQIRLSFSGTVTDKNDQSVIYSTRLNRRSEQTYRIDTDEGSVLFAPSLEEILEELTRDAIREFVQQIAPRKATIHVSLMKGPDDNLLFAEALSLVEKGSYATALQHFLTLWETQHLHDAAYNAALVSESLGERESAIELMNQIDSQRAEKQLKRMMYYREQSETAQSQY